MCVPAGVPLPQPWAGSQQPGDTSVATMCVPAGVPLPQPVAGIAMGLLLDTETKKFVVLSDILGGYDLMMVSTPVDPWWVLLGDDTHQGT